MQPLPNKLHHICSECDSEFVISYNEEMCEDDPIHCPFCGEYLVILGDEFTEDEDE
jgi:DNA-directed RNA polymerase subunit RPC12/RpoP